MIRLQPLMVRECGDVLSGTRRRPRRHGPHRLSGRCGYGGKRPDTRIEGRRAYVPNRMRHNSESTVVCAVDQTPTADTTRNSAPRSRRWQPVRCVQAA